MAEEKALVPREDLDLSCKGPILCLGSKAGSHGVLNDIFPFCRVALSTSHDVIEEPVLPKRTLLARGLQVFREKDLQAANPSGDSL